MNKSVKTSRLGVGLSFAGVLLSATSMLLSGFRGIYIITFVCVAAVLCVNFAVYKSLKKKAEDATE